jgi:hypothetical protein
MEIAGLFALSMAVMVSLLWIQERTKIFDYLYDGWLWIWRKMNSHHGDPMIGYKPRRYR